MKTDEEIDEIIRDIVRLLNTLKSPTKRHEKEAK